MIYLYLPFFEQSMHLFYTYTNFTYSNNIFSKNLHLWQFYESYVQIFTLLEILRKLDIPFLFLFYFSFFKLYFIKTVSECHSTKAYFILNLGSISLISARNMSTVLQFLFRVSGPYRIAFLKRSTRSAIPIADICRYCSIYEHDLRH